MAIEARYECTIEFAPRRSFSKTVGKKTVSIHETRGTVRVGSHNIVIDSPRSENCGSNSGFCCVVDPVDIDGLIGALVEARAIGRHFFGNGRH